MAETGNKPDFRAIQFGQASAELEGAAFPQLLTDGYLDVNRTIELALNSPKYIFLGYKGSGKSAIGEHLKLTAGSDPKLFVTQTFLADFPYTNFKKIVSGDAEPEAKYPTAWSWLILVSIIDSFLKDEGSPSNLNPDFLHATQALRKVGMLPAPSLKQIALTSSKKAFKAKLPMIEVTEDIGNIPGQDLQFMHLVEYLKQIVVRFESDSTHYLVIDGLDDILTSRDVQYQSLAALVLETSRLNLLFQSNNTPAKIVLLCRTELYERLPGPNKNKFRQDYSVELILLCHVDCLKNHVVIARMHPNQG